MFGSTSFPNQPTSTFGSFTAAANTATPSLFGQTQQNTAMPLFGGAATNTGFNTPMKQTTFGTSFGSTPSSVVTPIFGAAQPNRLAPASTTGGIFSNQVTAITPFTQGQAQGTSIPFNPLSGTDTMMRNGQPSPISTRHQCITCMKEYENKSLEELRMEDYQLGRKGSAQAALFGGGVTQQQTSIFSGLGAATAPAFGQRTTTFGTPAANTGLFSNINQAKPPSLFSNTNTGTTFNTPTFSFPTTTTQSTGLMFNQNNATATTAPPFSFNTQPQTQMNLFNTKPLTAPTTTTTTFTGFNTTLNKPPGIFASTASAPFGTTNTLGTSTAGTSLFSQPTQSKPFQPFSFNTQPTTQQFGQTPASTFSFSTPATTTTSVSFGTTPAPMFGGGTATTGFSFNPNPTAISLGAPTTTATTFPPFNFSSQQQPSTQFSFFNTNPATNTMAPTNLQVAPQSTGPVPFATTPYKDSPLFYNVITNRSLEEMTKPTNPLAHRAVKEASRRRTSSHFSNSSSPSALGNLTFSASRNSSYSHKSSIFDGFEEDVSPTTIDVLSPRTSIKKLSLKDIPGFNEPVQVPILPAPKFTPSDSTRAEANNMRGRFSSRSVDYTLSGNVGESSSAASLTSANSERQIPAAEESQQQQQSNNVSPTTPLSTHDPLKGRRHMRSRNKSGVKCSRAGYYMEPTLEELDALTDEDGHCFLEGFLIGRHNFGHIQFIQPVDVGGLNLDDLVHFRHKETVVYPDDSAKPPVGEGINVPAEITMERIWPVDKSTQEPVKSPEKVKSLNYEEKLRRSCKRMDAEFISYDSELGVWKFRVKHFSKYTCEPEENEENKVETAPPVNVKPRQERSGLGGVNVEEFKLVPPPGLTVKQELDKGSSDFSILKKELGEPGKSEYRAYPYPKTILSPIYGESDNGNGMDDTDTDEDIEFNPLTPSECESDYTRDDAMMDARKEPLYESVLADRAASAKIGLMRSVFDMEENVDDIAPAKRSRPPRIDSSRRKSDPRRGRKESDAAYALSTTKGGKWGVGPSELPIKQEFDSSRSYVKTPPPAPRSIIKYEHVGATLDKDLEFSLSARGIASPADRKPLIASIPLTSGGICIVQPKEMKLGDDFRPRQLLQQLTLEDSVTEDKFGRLIKPRMQVRKVVKKAPAPLVAVRNPEDMFAELFEEATCVPSRSSRGVRVGFGPGGHFLQIRNVRTTRPGGYNGQVKVMRLQPHFETMETENTPVKAVRALKRQLEMQRESSELFGEGKFVPCPFGNVASHAEALKDLRLRAATGNGSAGRNNNEILEEEEAMWNLCKILWPADQVEKKFTGRLDRRFCYYQRQAFTQWLVADGVRVFRDLGRDNSVSGLVRRGQKLKACEEAVEQDNCTLALCMAQSSYDAKETTDLQMLKWEICNAEEFLSPELKELYQVCSGCPIWTRLNLCRMTTTEWLQHFAIYIWYLAPINQSIPRVVELYHRFINMAIVPASCDSDTSDLNFPAATDEEATVANLCINLLKAYSCSGYPVKKLLSPRIRSPDALDYKTSWLLMNNVIRFGFQVETDLLNVVSQSFAGQLEALGCFEWAVFVLLHCDPSEERTCLIKRILERNVCMANDVGLEKFIASIGVSPNALWEAKVVAAVRKRSNYEEVWYLLKSGRHNEAYQVFLAKCRKNLLSPKRMGSTFTLLEEMAKVGRQIHGWEGYGGALYNLMKAMECVDREADFPRDRLFPALPDAVASFGRICPRDAVDFHLVVAMGFIIKYLLQVVVDRPPTDTLHMIDQMRVLQFPTSAPEVARFPRRLEEYFKKLRFNEAGVQVEVVKPFMH